MKKTKNFKILQAEYKQKLDFEITKYFNENMPSGLSKYGVEAWKSLQEFSNRPGKRIRGSQVLFSYEMFNGQDKKSALNAGVAIELVQNYLLIIDDVMDKSEIRRGGPTVHQEYLKKLKSTKDSKHISEMIAINIGMIASHCSAQLMSELPINSKNVLKANKYFHANILNTGYGQIDDLYNCVGVKTEKQILNTYQLKSSYYTFINPLQVGAILAGANSNDLELIRKFGLHAGVAFQLIDDEIGLFGIQSKTGKSNLDDLVEGKFTLLIQHALVKSNEKQKKYIQQNLGKNNLTESQADKIRDIVIKTGSKDYSKNLAKTQMNKALKVLESSNWSEYDKEYLSQMLEFVINRDK